MNSDNGMQPRRPSHLSDYNGLYPRSKIESEPGP